MLSINTQELNIENQSDQAFATLSIAFDPS